MFLDESAHKKIADVVAEEEKRTSGEIVVVIAAKSSSWWGQRSALGVSLASIGFVLALLVKPDLHPGWGLGLLPVLFVIGVAVASVPAVLRWLVFADAAEEKVLRAAKVAFLDFGVHHTEGRSGVLVYLSLLERRVQILGDAGIHKVIGDEGWKKHVDAVARAMHAHNVDGLIAVVKELGSVLSSSFPRKEGDKNELPDAVRVV
jgi:putative membrane protein